jgi:ComF family protein
MSLIIDWLFPKNCFGCSKGEKYLCSLCESQLETGLLTRKKMFEGVISVYKYDGLIKKIIEKIKYEYVSDALEELSQLMGKKLLLDYPNVVKYWQKEKFTIVPIPLFWQRENWRGFNQSEILAVNLANFLKLKCDSNILRRKIKTKNQATIKNREKRRNNIRDVFEINSKIKAPKKVILVDDVITSGATITAAMRTLELSGTQMGWGLSLCGVQR